jgi:AcrR family transcriptional regulator
LDAAELLVQREGVEALTVRRLADEVGTSTRAIYSLFGSKAGLIDVLGARAFAWLAQALDAGEPSDDPVADLVEAGASAFRRLVIEHPALFRVGFKGTKDDSDAAHSHKAAVSAMQRLLARVDRLQDAGLLHRRTSAEAAWEFHALCEGLAHLELRGSLQVGQSEPAWRNALTSLVTGLTAPYPP